MAEKTNIAWCDHTFNPWIGCAKVSEECRHCYAESLAQRYGWAQWGVGQVRARTSTGNWEKPLHWARKAAREGIRRRVFCASLADVFDADVSDGWRDELVRLIDQTPTLDWLLLTKRPDEAARYLSADSMRPNVWLGASVGAVKSKSRIEALRRIPAAVKFLSCEPLLEDLGELDLTGIDWVIVGGESGTGARVMQPDWVRSVQRQCVAQRTAFFFKQLGAVWAHSIRASSRAGEALLDIPTEFRLREFPR